jgi:Ku protein
VGISASDLSQFQSVYSAQLASRPSGEDRDIQNTVQHEVASSNTRAEEPTFAPVQQAALTTDSARVLPAKSVHRGYEYEKDRFVLVDPEELKSITPKTATEMEILEFVRPSEIDPIYFEASYSVRPEKPGEKPYALLYRALQVSQLVAVARFAMHSRQHVVILRPGKRGRYCTHDVFCFRGAPGRRIPD